MSLFTLIGRVADGMVLVASHDDNSLQDLKQQAKRLLKSFKPTSPAKCTIDPNGPYHFCYIIEQGVCYLTLAEKSYPKKLAFQFLEQVAKEFSEAHQAEVARYSRPFAAVAFDPKLNRLRKEFLDPNSQKNMSRLNADLSDIQLIMKNNINEVLQRGEKLENVQSMSTNLLAEAKKFESSAKYINMQAWLKTYGPLIGIAFVWLFFVYWRFIRARPEPST